MINDPDDMISKMRERHQKNPKAQALPALTPNMIKEVISDALLARFMHILGVTEFDFSLQDLHDEFGDTDIVWTPHIDDTSSPERRLRLKVEAIKSQKQ